jgi:YidC/Oxa1 family membrane protein insertase
MDKRFLLALVLTALVVVATPILFPNPTPARRTPVSATSDSSRPASSIVPAPSVAPRDSARVPAPPPSQVAANPLTDSLSAPVAVAPVETTIVDSLTQYRLSNIGATPVSVVMRKHRALNGATGQVDLVRPGEPLLRYRLVVPGDTISLERVPFQVEQQNAQGGASIVRYSAALETAQIAITYSFVPDSYLVRVRGQVTPVNGVAPAFVLIDLPTGLRSAEADTIDDQRHLAYALKPQRDNARSISFDNVEPGERRLEAGPLTWVAAKSKYFIVGLLTDTTDTPFAELAVTGGARTSKVPSTAQATAVEPITSGSFEFELYAGPQEWKRLLALGRDFENSNPYGGFMQGVVQPFATIVMRVLLWMRATLDISYGWVLVIFGVVVRLILWPLNQGALRTSMKMQRIQPQLSELQKRFKNDPQKLQSEMMRVYKEHDMSPFSTFSGCLPMLLPMPILFALFFVFQNTIEFRGVPFLWLSDISLKDPYYILPLLMGVSMYVLSWIGLRNAPPNPQAKMMAYMMPVMMTFLLLNLASGLNLYYAVQNLAALPQQWLIAKERSKAAGTAPQAIPRKA